MGELEYRLAHLLPRLRVLHLELDRGSEIAQLAVTDLLARAHLPRLRILLLNVQTSIHRLRLDAPGLHHLSIEIELVTNYRKGSSHHFLFRGPLEGQQSHLKPNSHSQV